MASWKSSHLSIFPARNLHLHGDFLDFQKVFLLFPLIQSPPRASAQPPQPHRTRTCGIISRRCGAQRCGAHALFAQPLLLHDALVQLILGNPTDVSSRIKSPMSDKASKLIKLVIVGLCSGYYMLLPTSYLQDVIPSGKLRQTLPDRGWKLSFQLKWVIYRVYVNLPEGKLQMDSTESMVLLEQSGTSAKIRGARGDKLITSGKFVCVCDMPKKSKFMFFFNIFELSFLVHTRITSTSGMSLSIWLGSPCASPCSPWSWNLDPHPYRLDKKWFTNLKSSTIWG